MSDDSLAGAPSDRNAATTATGSVAERIDPNKKLASHVKRYPWPSWMNPLTARPVKAVLTTTPGNANISEEGKTLRKTCQFIPLALSKRRGGKRM